MPLTSGSRLGPYEVTAHIGAGGMGQVFRAHHTTLNRDVALKVLPEAFALDPDRLARFRREAQVLASLNHPNIAAIYGFEEGSGTQALVLELVDGPTLADRIASGPIAVPEALRIVRQLADALEAAHEPGIIHRDLKPANIKIRPDGTVKVLDFGLARTLDPVPATSGSATMSPTVSIHATQAGLILGTAAYMSPEQAAGRQTDKRTDLWAFGVVLLEMLTGRSVFEGETVSHVLAAVLKSEPDWTRLPADTPPPVQRLLRRCLEKDPKRRLDSACVARLEIDDALASRDDDVVFGERTSRRRVIVAAVAALLTVATLAAFATWAIVGRTPQPPRMLTRYAVVTSPGEPPWVGPFNNTLAISRDGTRLVYATNPGTGPGGSLVMRSSDRLDAMPLPGITRSRAPFFSPDSQWVGFSQGNLLKKVPVGGGTPITICRYSGGPRGASWTDDGTIVFATADPRTGLWRVPSGGGEPTPLTTPVAGEGDHLFPSVLPGGRGVLFTIILPGRPDTAEIAVIDLTSNQRRTLIRGGTTPEYTESGHLVYAGDGSLRAVRFDLRTLSVKSDAVPVLEHVHVAQTGAAFYAISRSGTLAYLPAGPQVQRTLAWVDRNGRETPIKAPPRAYYAPRISPDGQRVALDIRDQENDVWILDLEDGSLRKLTYGKSFDTNPVWTPDGRYIIYSSNQDGTPSLYRRPVDGSGIPERLPASGFADYATGVSHDGSFLLGHHDGPSSFDVTLFPLHVTHPADARTRGGASAKPRELIRTENIEHNAQLSPDGRFIAYQTNESGRYEVLVRPFPDVNSGNWTISNAGGVQPVWARNGRELFYRDESLALMAVPVDTRGSTFRWGTPVKLFDTNFAGAVPDRNYDVSPDGQHFLAAKQTPNSREGEIVVVLDWLEELKRLVR